MCCAEANELARTIAEYSTARKQVWLLHHPSHKYVRPVFVHHGVGHVPFFPSPCADDTTIEEESPIPTDDISNSVCDVCGEALLAPADVIWSDDVEDWCARVGAVRAERGTHVHTACAGGT